MSRLNTVEQVLAALQSYAQPERIKQWNERYKVDAQKALGVTQAEINTLLKNIEKSNELAVGLWHTEIYEARMICAKIFRPKDLSWKLVELWTSEFDDWALCDTFSMKVFAKSELAHEIIMHFAQEPGEYQKRTAFATLAAFAQNRKAPDLVYHRYRQVLINACTDERNFVKKAVSWAVRGIGKRNPQLNQWAVELACEMGEIESKSANWISKDVLKELQGPCRLSYYPRT